MINLKREYFRNSINKQTREAIFKKKRIVTQPNNYIEHDPLYSSTNLIEIELNQLFKQEFSMCFINDKLKQLCHEFNLFPERHLEIMTQIKILGIKVAESRDQRYINEFYQSLQVTLLSQILWYCDYQFENDPNTSEINNNCLWIMINLTLADGCIDFILQNTNLLQNLKILLQSKYVAIVSRVLDLLFNITIEQRACMQLVQDKEFEKAFSHVLVKNMPENLLHKEAAIIRNFFYNVTDEHYPKVINFLFDCIQVESLNGLIELLDKRKNCLEFLQDSFALCTKIFHNTKEALNFILYLTSNSDDEVLEKLESNYHIVDLLIHHNKHHKNSKIYQALANFATIESCLINLRKVFHTLHDEYIQSDLKMKMEIGYFAGTYIKNCDVTYYQDLIQWGVVQILVQYVQDIYDPNYVQIVLDALECLSIDEHARQIFRGIGGPEILEKLNQTQSIIEIVQRIKWM